MMVYPDSKVHGANIGPTWVLSVPAGPHFALWTSCYPGSLLTQFYITWHWSINILFFGAKIRCWISNCRFKGTRGITYINRNRKPVHFVTGKKILFAMDKARVLYPGCFEATYPEYQPHRLFAADEMTGILCKIRTLIYESCFIDTRELQNFQLCTRVISPILCP